MVKNCQSILMSSLSLSLLYALGLLKNTGLNTVQQVYVLKVPRWIAQDKYGEIMKKGQYT